MSQKKNRLKTDGYNLDLTYITNYVIALGYPASGVDVAIRNNREDVISYFEAFADLLHDRLLQQIHINIDEITFAVDKKKMLEEVSV